MPNVCIYFIVVCVFLVSALPFDILVVVVVVVYFLSALFPSAWRTRIWRGYWPARQQGIQMSNIKMGCILYACVCGFCVMHVRHILCCGCLMMYVWMCGWLNSLALRHRELREILNRRNRCTQYVCYRLRVLCICVIFKCGL